MKWARLYVGLAAAVPSEKLFFVTRDNWSGTILRIPSDY